MDADTQAAGKADHWEHLIIPRIGKLFDAFPKDFPTGSDIGREAGLVFGTDRQKFKQLSPNHWSMGINCELLRSVAYGTAKEYDAARAVVLFYLDVELNQLGLWQSEQYTGAPHGGMHMNAMFSGRLAALRKQDSELLKLQDEHLRRIFTYLAATATPSGEIVCCGERQPKGPNAPQQSAIWREAKNLQHPDRKKAEKQIADDFWAPLRGFKVLLAKGDKLGGALTITTQAVTEMPLTARRVEVQRWDGGHLAKYGEPTRAGSTAWVRVDHHNDHVEWSPDAHNTPTPPQGRRIKTVPRKPQSS